MFGKAEIATTYTENVMVIPYGSLVEADGNNGFVFTTIGTHPVVGELYLRQFSGGTLSSAM